MSRSVVLTRENRNAYRGSWWGKQKRKSTFKTWIRMGTILYFILN
jgi:hypothetical protein